MGSRRVCNWHDAKSMKPLVGTEFEHKSLAQEIPQGSSESLRIATGFRATSEELDPYECNPLLWSKHSPIRQPSLRKHLVKQQATRVTPFDSRVPQPGSERLQLVRLLFPAGSCANRNILTTCCCCQVLLAGSATVLNGRTAWRLYR